MQITNSKLNNNKILLYQFLLLSIYLLNIFFFNFFLIKIIIICIFLLFLVLIVEQWTQNKYLFFLIVLLSIVSMGSPTIDWDARSIWLFNAKRLFFNADIKKYLQAYTNFNNPDYPIFSTSISSSIAILINGWNEIFPKFSSILIVTPSIIIIVSKIKNKIWNLLLITILIFILEKKIINGEQDAILALYYLSTGIIIHDFFLVEKFHYLESTKKVFFILNITILSLLKYEAIAIIASLYIATLIIKIKNKIKLSQIIKISILFLFGILNILLWKLIVYESKISFWHNQLLSLDNLYINIFNLKKILIILESIFTTKTFVISMIILSYALGAFFIVDIIKSKINKIIKMNFILLFFYSNIFYFFFLLIVYISSNIDIVVFLNTSVDRYTLPISLSSAFVSIYILEKIHIIIKKK